MIVALIVVIVLLLVVIALQIIFRPKPETDIHLSANIDRLASGFKEDFLLNRTEAAHLARQERMEVNSVFQAIRDELANALTAVVQQNQHSLQLLLKAIEEQTAHNRDTMASAWKEFILEQRHRFEDLRQTQKESDFSNTALLEKINAQTAVKLTTLTQQQKEDSLLLLRRLEEAFHGLRDNFDRNLAAFNALQKEKFSQLDLRQSQLMESNEKKLEEMRVTVDEKLQKTLQERLGHSFELVGRQLESVQKGLGEMQALAQDVGGLKKVLGNVKMRGGIGEVQLAMLLEQVLAPEQYAANVKTKEFSSDLVEFAIKLPGRDEGNSVVWLPVDAKFPKDVYEQLQDAYELADPGLIDAASKNMEAVIKKMAKDIRDKYIDPPGTTDFAIMFLPFEGIYAEVVRRASLLDVLQREYKVIVTGPTTLAAILNSLQMGFRTLALQRSSSEVWKILGGVKAEFNKFGGLMEKAQRNLHVASSQIDELLGSRTRAINRKLQQVQALPGDETQNPAEAASPQLDDV